jgi:hypothetical protein
LRSLQNVIVPVVGSSHDIRHAELTIFLTTGVFGSSVHS